MYNMSTGQNEYVMYSFAYRLNKEIVFLLLT